VERPDERRCPDDTRRAQPNRWPEPSVWPNRNVSELRGENPSAQAAHRRVILSEIGEPTRRALPPLSPPKPRGWRGFDRLRPWRIIHSEPMTRDAIMAELLEIEGLHGARQAPRNILDPETWHQASQTF
jgi:hypothetical protein